ncbi:GPRGNR2 family protein [Megaselia abdita]
MVGTEPSSPSQLVAQIVASLNKTLTTMIMENFVNIEDSTYDRNVSDAIDLFLTNETILPYLNSPLTIPTTPPPYTQQLEHAPKLLKSTVIKVIVLSAMAMISLLGNIATMWNIYKTRMTRRSSRHSWSAIYSLIFHLSISDVLVTGFCIIGEAAWSYTVEWLADDFTCKFVKMFQMFSLYLSTYVLVLIGIDRWIAVKYPMKSLNMAKRCYRLLGGIYVLSFILSLPQFFIFRVARGPFIEEFYQCVTHGFYTADWQEQFYNTFTLFFTFIIPLCILFLTYVSTFRTISGSEKMFQGSKLAVYTNKPTVQTNRQRLIHKAKMKSLRISVVIIVAFLICWTPYNVMMIIFTFLNPDKRVGEELQSGIFFFGMSNSLVNPLIYGAFHLCPLKRKDSKYGHYSLTRENSQRSPSLMTAVTQIDCNGRQIRTFRQPSYYRTNSQNNQKEQITLLHSGLGDKNSPINRHMSRHKSSNGLVGGGGGAGGTNAVGAVNNNGKSITMNYNGAALASTCRLAKDNISSV